MTTTQHRPRIWAHRGDSSRFPENTLAAFRAALEGGADGIELDVHWTKDQQVVVIHDPDVSRTTDGHGLVSQLTFAQVAEMDAGIRHGKQFQGERIPTLDQVLALVSSHPGYVTLNIELKREASRDMDEQVLHCVHKYALDGQVIYSSFDHVRLRDIRRHHSGAKIGLLYDEYLVDPWLYAQYLGADAIHPNYLSVDAILVENTVLRGIGVNVWTVNSLEDAKELAEWGVDAIMTDCPAQLSAHIRQQTVRPNDL